MQELIIEQRWQDAEYEDDFDVYLFWPSLQTVTPYIADFSFSSSEVSVSSVSANLRGSSDTPRLAPCSPSTSISSIDLNIGLTELNSQHRGILQAGYSKIFSLGFLTSIINRHITRILRKKLTEVLPLHRSAAATEDVYGETLYSCNSEHRDRQLDTAV